MGNRLQKESINCISKMAIDKIPLGLLLWRKYDLNSIINDVSEIRTGFERWESEALWEYQET